jgi:hypothetical protein
VIKYKATYESKGKAFAAPEGFYFKASHVVVVDGKTYLQVIWEGRETPSGLVKLCNLLVRAAYADKRNEPTTPAIIAGIERELDAHGLREPT